MEIRKGIIAAAGVGSRFLPLAKGCPKGLVPILNKPIVQYLVEEMITAGIDQIAIVHNPGDNRIKRYFSREPELEKSLSTNKKEKFLASLHQLLKKIKRLEFIPQARHLPYGNATPILAAKSFINQQPFVYMFGDDFLVEDKPGQYLTHLVKTFKKYQPASIIGVQKIDLSEAHRYGIIKYLENPSVPHQIKGVVEKPSIEETPSNMAVFGRFIISPKIFPVLAKQKIRDNELWLTDANNTLAKTDVVIAEPIKNGFWTTAGDPLRWLQTNLIMALRDKEMKPKIQKFIQTMIKK